MKGEHIGRWLSISFGREFNDITTNDMWFQEDAAMCHLAHLTWMEYELTTEIVLTEPARIFLVSFSVYAINHKPQRFLNSVT